MDKNTKIQSLMTLCPYFVGLDQSIDLARRLMHEHIFHHLPVIEGGNLVGVVSDRDLKFAIAWSGMKGSTYTVRDVYTPEPYIVEPTTRLETVLRRMVQDRIGCALVAVNKDKLVGIFTTTDACRHLAEILASRE